MTIYTATIAVSVLLFIAIGSYAGRKVKSIDDYFVAGRRAPTLLIVGTLVASVFSTSIFLGEAGFTYDGQLGPYLLCRASPSPATSTAPCSSAPSCAAAGRRRWRTFSASASPATGCSRWPASPSFSASAATCWW
jgi:hypothetical protein